MGIDKFVGLIFFNKRDGTFRMLAYNVWSCGLSFQCRQAVKIFMTCRRYGVYLCDLMDGRRILCAPLNLSHLKSSASPAVDF